MIYTTETLLDTTSYGTPSGNYDGSSLDFLGGIVPAANYYKGNGNFQTIIVNVTDFVGIISIQSSLNTLGELGAWAEVLRFGDGSTVETGIFPYSVPGNFVWLRCEVLGFNMGTINSITVSY